MASLEMLHAITKHVMGDCSEFTALKKRFKDFDVCLDQPTAAALAYLIAKDELEAEKEEEEEEPDVYDKAVEVVKKYGHFHGHISPHTATDEIFTLIYKWLNKELIKVAYRDGAICVADVNLLFEAFIIEKPKQ
jgi:hypothetical protein